jgi:hypothetical protein
MSGAEDSLIFVALILDDLFALSFRKLAVKLPLQQFSSFSLDNAM